MVVAANPSSENAAAAARTKPSLTRALGTCGIQKRTYGSLLDWQALFLGRGRELEGQRLFEPAFEGALQRAARGFTAQRRLLAGKLGLERLDAGTPSFG